VSSALSLLVCISIAKPPLTHDLLQCNTSRYLVVKFADKYARFQHPKMKMRKSKKALSGIFALLEFILTGRVQMLRCYTQALMEKQRNQDNDWNGYA
jgi:hypothetical protein